MKNKIIIPKGFSIGHANDDYTGVTVICTDGGAIGGVDVRGGAPGTRETDLLKSEKKVDTVNAVVLSGGSAYGLASTVGVMKYFLEKGEGVRVGRKIVPIVPSAVIYDLNDKDYHFPDAEMGYLACKNASTTPEFGQVGAGKGATVGKIRGIKSATKSGIGVATQKVLGVTVTAVVVCNAMGDVYDCETNQIIAGARDKNGSFLDTDKCIRNGEFAKLFLGSNTTIGCIMTDAKLDKVGANKLASIAHNGFAKAISPVHTDFDGDTMFCLCSGKKVVLNLLPLYSAVVEATKNAILNAVSDCKDIEILAEDEIED